ncbi:hypothetical protein RBH20_09740 [Haloarcula sp. H-GB4]|uniref:hypothetical protein n=1 Tax=Haloarcula sp. H-GB4 TaxID=3069755 RepID=UPI0027B78682|nr:hypothetical protein [Haloarcula sp. H-GB4]MDQ2072815.1 hypothetical protein [Haloarcula sp. H-GB4]
MTRRSKRELSSAVDALDDGADPPLAGLITVISTEYNGGSVEFLNDGPGAVLINGERHRLTETARNKLLEGST